jgi:hypothetical protein
MKKQTQMQWVKNQLTENGYVTRNEALKEFITRLGAVMLLLKKEGWIYSAGYLKTKKGQDYIYTLMREGK